MHDLLAVSAGHPLRVAPYTAINFVRFDHCQTPLFQVGADAPVGARKAMAAAHRLHGSSCFYCGRPMPGDTSPDLFTLDHVLATAKGGRHDLHNLVFCCKPCNSAKGVNDVARFHPGRAIDYAQAVDLHVRACLTGLVDSGTAPPATGGAIRAA